MSQPAADQRLLHDVRSRFGDRLVSIERPERSEFPEQIVTVPDEWPSILLAPLYDVHIGHKEHDAAMFERHLAWLQRTPHVLTWNGGDMIENASKLSVGSGVYEQDYTPGNQLVRAMQQLADVQNKMLFALPGNHEARSAILGLDVARWMAMMLEVPYFSDYCFCTVRWRGNNFRILAHHGSGAAQTAGAQRMAARKAVPWAKPVDMIWTGHLHSPLVDVMYQTDYDQQTGRMFERNALVIISPSYIKYFGTYAAAKQYSPGARGLAVVELQEDGRMDVSVHANGRRL